MRKLIFLLIFESLISLSCRKSNTSDGAKQTSETLQSVAPFPVGAAVSPEYLYGNGDYSSVVNVELNSITPDNSMKWAAVEPSQSIFNYDDADRVALFAMSHHKRLHGHNLCWSAGNPDWLNKFQGDSAAWSGLLKEHILSEVNHFKGKVSSWDVVNEAIQDNNSGEYRNIQTDPANDDGSIWFRNIGVDYIAQAFNEARTADPDAVLFYNEYNTEVYPGKLNAVLNLIADLKSKNVPIGGIGLQMHISIVTPDDSIAMAIKAFVSTGLMIHISELDIVANLNWDPHAILTSDLEKQQSAKFAFVVSQYKSLVPKAQQWGITTWNVGDKDSWWNTWLHRNDWPLLFDSSYNKKASYFSFLQALKN